MSTSDKRELILDAALELFAERGFHGTVVPAIAERAGVGAGTLYRYFAGKDEIVNVLYRHWKGEFGAILEEELAAEGTVPARFSRFLDRAFDFCIAHPAAARFLETHHHQDYLDEESREASLAAMAPALRFFEEAQAGGYARSAPPCVLAALVWGGFIGVVRTIWAAQVPDGPELRRLTTRSLWDAVRQ